MSIEMTAKTGSGEYAIVEVYDTRIPPMNWLTRYITADCPGCPFFIPPVEMTEIVKAIREGKTRGKFIPDKLLGLCVFSGFPKSLVRGRRLGRDPNPTLQQRLARASNWRSEHYMGTRGNLKPINQFMELAKKAPVEKEEKPKGTSPQMRLSGF